MTKLNTLLYIRQIEVGPMENFVYLVGDSQFRECVMVDPAWEVDRVLKIAAEDGMKVVGGLATHYHYDHINGAEELLGKIKGKVYIHKSEAPYLKGMKRELEMVDAGYQLKVGSVKIDFLHTPGHTPGSQCFLVQNNLVSGDTLFIGACGRCDLPGGDAEELFRSLTKLSKLEDSTILFPGHNYADEVSSTIGKEKIGNPYLKAGSMKEFLTRRLGY